MKKKSIAIRLGVVAMALTMVTTSLSSGTLAKFTSTVNSYAGFSVARWNVSAKVTKADGTTTWASDSDDLSTAGLLSTTMDTTKTVITNEDGTKNLVGDGVLAPGTHGSFKVTVSDALKAGGSFNYDTAATQVKTDYTVYIRRVDTGSFMPPEHLTFKQIKEGEASKEVILMDDTDATSGYESGDRHDAYEDDYFADYTTYVAGYGLPLAKGTFSPEKLQEANHKEVIDVQWDWDYEYTKANGESDSMYKKNFGDYDKTDTDNASTKIGQLDQVKFVISVVFTQSSDIVPAGT